MAKPDNEGPPAADPSDPGNQGDDAPMRITPVERSTASGLEVYTPEQGISKTNEAGAAVLAARVEAEVKARALVAISRPRNVDRFRLRLMEACGRSAFADVARYAKPIGGAKVYGLSIRFAEECVRHYGNLDISSAIVSEDDERRVVECCVVDLEVNTPWRISVVVPKTVERKNPKQGDEVVRRRQNSKGETVAIVRATDDQVFTAQMALTSKAIRNLVLNHIPSEIKEEAEQKILETQRGEARKDPTKYRRKLVDAFFAIGVTPEQLVEYLGKSLEDANEAELFMLKSLGEAIKQNEGTWAEIMEERRVVLGRKSSESQTGNGGAGAKLRDAVATPAKK